MVRHAISQQSHEKIGDCEQSTIFIIFKIAAGESPGRSQGPLFYLEHSHCCIISPRWTP